ncbi:FkbM family methyltransferase [Pseudoxanthomonas gei]|uniref:FkbM family methyltransferase n=1 Tax=Pseudoxanthomonas gei TaxID=1383030 RepID=A0ABX0AHG5_9GAMM|nr:FkbM family methyltransferase [Pseudoxanthomonas gei]NDK38663.1 FkbM family methyltransferase [Pseudoxanthomonas gei]
MTFISYAQNFEDIALWRALQFFPGGFYIDVGANDPNHDSVTRAYYERGWRGINVEPVDVYYQALCRERPGDTNLQLVVGETQGEVDFHVFPDSGLSTASDEMVAMYAASGIQLEKCKLPMRTLASLCEEYVSGEIHFLKIDVEGFEGAVLRGMDFSRWRPWLIVIETPFDQEPEWKDIVPAAGYRKVRFDGINTFYLANEHANLAGAFDIPPCTIDEFHLRYGHPLAFPVGAAEAALREQARRAELAEARVRELEGSRWFRLGQQLNPVRRLLRR